MPRKALAPSRPIDPDILIIIESLARAAAARDYAEDLAAAAASCRAEPLEKPTDSL